MTAPGTARKRRTPLAQILIPCLLAALLAVAYFFYVYRTQPKPVEPDTAKAIHDLAKRILQDETLAAEYADTDGDKLADPPMNPAEWVDPPVLYFCFIASDDPVESEKLWKPLMDHLNRETGKPVKFLTEIPRSISKDEPKPKAEEGEIEVPKMKPVGSAAEQIEALKGKHLHITAFNTGSVPQAVAQAGFHPLFAFADEQGRFTYEMQIVVPATSDINSPADLRGKTIGFVALSSNSGGRAPLVLLKEKFDLQPGRDYQYLLKGDHRRAAKELLTSTTPANFQAACIAGDILQQMIAQQELDEGRFKTVFQSASFPKATFGVPHNLHPELRKKIIAAFKSFRLTDEGLKKKYSREKTVKFEPIVYAKAYADVLDINARLAKLYEKQP